MALAILARRGIEWWYHGGEDFVSYRELARAGEYCNKQILTHRSQGTSHTSGLRHRWVIVKIHTQQRKVTIKNDKFNVQYSDKIMNEWNTEKTWPTNSNDVLR